MILCRSPKSPEKFKKISILAFKVIQGHWIRPNRKPVYDFLLVINSNLGLISHRYWDTASYWPKIVNFDHPPLIYGPRSEWPPSNLWKSFTVPETKVFQAADGENLVILAWTVFAWSTRVTDRQTELRWLRRAESIAAFARKKPYVVRPYCECLWSEYQSWWQLQPVAVDCWRGCASCGWDGAGDWLDAISDRRTMTATTRQPDSTSRNRSRHVRRRQNTFRNMQADTTYATAITAIRQDYRSPSIKLNCRTITVQYNYNARKLFELHVV